MNNSVRLLVLLMVVWAMIVVLFNLLGQAFAAPYYDNSSIASRPDFRGPNQNGHVPVDMLGYRERDHALNESDPNRPLVDLVYMGQGFAIKGNESHALFVSVQKLRHVEPMIIRNLMNANKSIEELKEAISEQKANIVYAGDIKISEYLYKLENININQSETGFCIDADLADALSDEESTSVVGHLVLIVLYEELLENCEGELIINANGFSGAYKILLSKPEHNNPA